MTRPTATTTTPTFIPTPNASAETALTTRATRFRRDISQQFCVGELGAAVRVIGAKKKRRLVGESASCVICTVPRHALVVGAMGHRRANDVETGPSGSFRCRAARRPTTDGWVEPGSLRRPGRRVGSSQLSSGLIGGRCGRGWHSRSGHRCPPVRHQTARSTWCRSGRLCQLGGSIRGPRCYLRTVSPAKRSMSAVSVDLRRVYG